MKSRYAGLAMLGEAMVFDRFMLGLLVIVLLLLAAIVGIMLIVFGRR